MVGSVCWRFCIWLLALLAVLTGNRHWCLPSLGYGDLSALVEGQVVFSWKRQEAIKYPRAVWSLTLHMVESHSKQNNFMPPNNTKNCTSPCCVLPIHSRLCTMSNNRSLGGMCAVVETVSQSLLFFFFVCLLLSLLTIWKVRPLGEAELMAVLGLTGIHRLGISTKTTKIGNVMATLRRWQVN